MNLEKKMCKELEILEEKYRSGAEMSEGDLRRVDLLVHSLKSLATYRAMRDAEDMQRGYGNQNMNNSGNSYMGNSYMRNNNSDGRYMSRDSGMSQEMSGHYPMNYHPMYPEERRW